MLLALVLLTAAAMPGLAQEWPAKTVKIIVPFGAGSTPDIVARLIADRLGQKYPGSVFLVENKPGASGNLGTDAVAKAAPDGATLGISIGGPLAINTLLFSTCPTIREGHRRDRAARHAAECACGQSGARRSIPSPRWWR